MHDDMSDAWREATDREHLRLLAIFHYIVGGIGAFFSSLGLVYVVLGLVMALAPDTFANNRDAQHHGPPPALGYLIAGLGTFVVLVGWTLAALTIYSGRCLQRLTRRTFSQVIAGLLCLWIPFGTVLGVFTLIVLSRHSVMDLYRGRSN